MAQFKIKSATANIQERLRRGLTWYPVTITHKDIGFGGKVVLELERPAGQQRLHLFQLGRNASLFGNSPGHSPSELPMLSGVITSLRRNKLQLTTSKEVLPEWITVGSKLGGGKLGIDLTFDEVSYREMDNALREVMRARGDRLAELRDVLLGARPARFREHRDGNTVYDDLFYPHSLNESQLAAVRHVMAAQDRSRPSAAGAARPC